MRKPTLAAALAAALLVAGCGGPDAGEYADAVENHVESYGNTVLTESRQITETSDDSTDDAALSALAQATRGLADDLGGMGKDEVPEEAMDEHDDLVREIRDYAGKVEAGEGLAPATAQTVARLKTVQSSMADDLASAGGGPIFATAPVFAISRSSSSSSSSSSSRSSSSSSSSSGSRSSSSSSSSSSGSKVSGGAKIGGGSKSGYSPSKPSTASKPSTGPKAQRAPVAKLVPPAPPKPSVVRPNTSTGNSTRALPTKYRVPAGRNYGRDRATILKNPRYADPYYGRGYYGAYDSPFFYMWLFSVMDDDRSNDPLPPQTGPFDMLYAYLGVIEQNAGFLDAKDAATP